MTHNFTIDNTKSCDSNNNNNNNNNNKLSTKKRQLKSILRTNQPKSSIPFFTMTINNLKKSNQY